MFDGTQITILAQEPQIHDLLAVYVGNLHYYTKICQTIEVKVVIRNCMSSLHSMLKEFTEVNQNTTFSECEKLNRVVIQTYEFASNETLSISYLLKQSRLLIENFAFNENLLQIVRRNNSYAYFNQISSLKIVESTTFSPISDGYLFSWPIGCQRSSGISRIYRRSLNVQDINQTAGLSLAACYVTRGYFKEKMEIFFGTISALVGTPLENIIATSFEPIQNSPSTIPLEKIFSQESSEASFTSQLNSSILFFDSNDTIDHSEIFNTTIFKSLANIFTPSIHKLIPDTLLVSNFISTSLYKTKIESSIRTNESSIFTPFGSSSLAVMISVFQKSFRFKNFTSSFSTVAYSSDTTPYVTNFLAVNNLSSHFKYTTFTLYQTKVPLFFSTLNIKSSISLSFHKATEYGEKTQESSMNHNVLGNTDSATKHSLLPSNKSEEFNTLVLPSFSLSSNAVIMVSLPPTVSLRATYFVRDVTAETTSLVTASSSLFAVYKSTFLSSTVVTHVNTIHKITTDSILPTVDVSPSISSFLYKNIYTKSKLMLSNIMDSDEALPSAFSIQSIFSNIYLKLTVFVSSVFTRVQETTAIAVDGSFSTQSLLNFSGLYSTTSIQNKIMLTSSFPSENSLQHNFFLTKSEILTTNLMTNTTVDLKCVKNTGSILHTVPASKCHSISSSNVGVFSDKLDSVMLSAVSSLLHSEFFLAAKSFENNFTASFLPSFLSANSCTSCTVQYNMSNVWPFSKGIASLFQSVFQTKIWSSPNSWESFLLPFKTKYLPSAVIEPVKTPINFFLNSENVWSSSNSASSTVLISSICATQSLINSAPQLIKPIGYLFPKTGRYFAFKIPAEMFSDLEDGNVRNLSLKCTTSIGDTLDLHPWLIFNATLQLLEGIPLINDFHKQEIGGLSLRLTAYDSQNNFAFDSFKILITEGAVRTALVITLKLSLDYSVFISRKEQRIKLAHRISGYFGDSESFVYISSLTNGSTVIEWTNTSLSENLCETASRILDKVRVQNSNDILPSFSYFLLPDFPVVAVSDNLQSLCTAIVPQSKQDILWYLIPIILLSSLVIILMLVLFVLCKKRARRKRYIKRGREYFEQHPPLFSEKLDLKYNASDTDPSIPVVPDMQTSFVGPYISNNERDTDEVEDNISSMSDDSFMSIVVPPFPPPAYLKPLPFIKGDNI